MAKRRMLCVLLALIPFVVCQNTVTLNAPGPPDSSPARVGTGSAYYATSLATNSIPTVDISWTVSVFTGSCLVTTDRINQVPAASTTVTLRGNTGMQANFYVLGGASLSGSSCSLVVSNSRSNDASWNDILSSPYTFSVDVITGASINVDMIPAAVVVATNTAVSFSFNTLSQAPTQAVALHLLYPVTGTFAPQPVVFPSGSMVAQSATFTTPITEQIQELYWNFQSTDAAFNGIIPSPGLKTTIYVSDSGHVVYSQIKTIKTDVGVPFSFGIKPLNPLPTDATLTLFNLGNLVVTSPIGLVVTFPAGSTAVQTVTVVFNGPQGGTWNLPNLASVNPAIAGLQIYGAPLNILVRPIITVNPTSFNIPYGGSVSFTLTVDQMPNGGFPIQIPLTLPTNANFVSGAPGGIASIVSGTTSTTVTISITSSVSGSMGIGYTECTDGTFDDLAANVMAVPIVTVGAVTASLSSINMVALGSTSFTVSRSPAPAMTVSFTFTKPPGSQLVIGGIVTDTVTFPPSSTTPVTVTVNALPPLTPGSYSLSLNPCTSAEPMFNGLIPTPAAIPLTIPAGSGSLTWSTPNLSLPAGGSATITLTANPAPTAALSFTAMFLVTCFLSFNAAGGSTITVAPGAASTSVTVSAPGACSTTVTFTAVSSTQPIYNGLSVQSFTVSTAAGPTGSIAISTSSITLAPSSSSSFSITVSQSPTQPVSIPVTLSGLTLTVAGVTVGSAITIPTGVTSLAVNVLSGSVPGKYSVTFGISSSGMPLFAGVTPNVPAVTVEITNPAVLGVSVIVDSAVHRYVQVNLTSVAGYNTSSSVCKIGSVLTPVHVVNTIAKTILCELPSTFVYGSTYPIYIRSSSSSSFQYTGSVLLDASLLTNHNCNTIRTNGRCLVRIAFSPVLTVSTDVVLSYAGGLLNLGTNTFGAPITIPAYTSLFQIYMYAGGATSVGESVTFSFTAASLPGVSVPAPQAITTVIVTAGLLTVSPASITARTLSNISVTVTASFAPSASIQLAPLVPRNMLCLSSTVFPAGSTTFTLILYGAYLSQVNPELTFDRTSSTDAAFDWLPVSSTVFTLIPTGTVFVSIPVTLDFQQPENKIITFTLNFPPSQYMNITFEVPSFIVLSGDAMIEPTKLSFAPTTAYAFSVNVSSTVATPQYGLLNISAIASVDFAFDGVVPTTVSVPVAISLCGDSVVSGQEQCDDGGTVSGDGCNSQCQIEPGWHCTGSTCVTLCGDGLRAHLEQCDDGNLNDHDGCASNCLLEPGFACTGGSPYYPDNCLACPAGQYAADPSSRACFACAPGSYTPSANHSMCLACPNGTYAPSSGSAQCYPCAAGTYGPSSSMVSCPPCSRTSYQPHNGSTVCLDCPANTEVRGVANDVSSCVCKEGYHNSNFNSTTSNTTNCLPCPEGGYCPGGNSPISPLQGYWIPLAADSLFSTSSVYRCGSTEACPGGSRGYCAVGYHGDLCAACDEGHYTLNGLCIACPKQAGVEFAFTILAIPAFCLFMYHFATSKFYTEDFWVVSLSSNFNCMVAYLQIVAVYSGFAVQWPSSIKNLMSGLSFFNFNLEFIKPQCFQPLSYRDRYLIQLASPLLFVATFLILYGGSNLGSALIRKYKGRNHKSYQIQVETDSPHESDSNGLLDSPSHQRSFARKSSSAWSDKAVDAVSKPTVLNGLKKYFKEKLAEFFQPLEFCRTLNAIILTIDLMCISLLSLAAQIWQLYQQPDGTLTLTTNPSIVYQSAEWNELLPLGVLAMFIYGGCIFLIYAYAALKAPQNWSNPYWRTVFNCLLCKYRKDTWYWCLVSFIRKLSLSFAITMVASNGFQQSMITLMMNTAFLVLYAHYWPWNSWTSNLLDVILLTCQVILTGFCFLFLNADSQSSDQNEILISFCVAIIVAGIVFSFYFAVYDFWVLYRVNVIDKKKPNYNGLTAQGEQVISTFEIMQDRYIEEPSSFRKWYTDANAFERFMIRGVLDAYLGDTFHVNGFRKRLMINPPASKDPSTAGPSMQTGTDRLQARGQGKGYALVRQASTSSESSPKSPPRFKRGTKVLPQPYTLTEADLDSESDCQSIVSPSAVRARLSFGRSSSIPDRNRISIESSIDSEIVEDF
eukprot:GILJ01001976.1.p1 GENE.GILJ01001976.1~~GILJ01001976.1.p1  ORF type:complete len:2118 (+),score=232.26 GILJ01001976.1:50-6355(+)